MIKLIVFDLDGVLVDARDIHYEAFNLALGDIDPKYVINREEHLSTYDGIPTSKKLKSLTEHKNFPSDKYNEAWKKNSRDVTKIKSNKQGGRKRQTPRFTV